MNTNVAITLSEELAAKVAAFSKANKVSKAKLQEFAVELLASKVASAGVGVGRKASEETLKLRDAVETVFNEFGAAAFTAKELAEKTGATPLEINNVLNFFKKLGKVAQRGLKEKTEKTRGRREVIWAKV